MHSRGKYVLAGGTGFIGRALAGRLVELGHGVVVLTRRPERGKGGGVEGVREVRWDAQTVGMWVDELEGAAGVVNLVGRTVDCVKTEANKREILRSRVDSVRAMAEGMRQVGWKGEGVGRGGVWVQTGTAHIYGDMWDELLNDDSPTGTGFAPDVGRAWEAAFFGEEVPSVRKVNLRISFVLGDGGGALRTLTGLARWGLGGMVGSGRQYISWIHMADMVELFVRALTEEKWRGTYVATAPSPVTNREFMRELRRAVGRPWSPPVPGILVRVGSVFLRTDPELALLGRRVVPKRLIEAGFEFEFPEVRGALENLLRS